MGRIGFIEGMINLGGMDNWGLFDKARKKNGIGWISYYLGGYQQRAYYA